MKGGRIEFDDATNAVREAGIVKLLLERTNAVVVLGGSHDLTERVPANVEYVRVATRRYKRTVV